MRPAEVEAGARGSADRIEEVYAFDPDVAKPQCFRRVAARAEGGALVDPLSAAVAQVDLSEEGMAQRGLETEAG